MDYKEKLRLAKEALDSGSYDRETIEYIFPELKKESENEDERIKNFLISKMKEVDLEKEIDKIDDVIPGKREDVEYIAKHFFELGLKTQKVE